MFVANADAYGTRVSVNAFVVKAIAVACQAVPIANAGIVGDEIVLWNEVNVGIAVSLPGQGEWDKRPDRAGAAQRRAQGAGTD